MKKHENKTERKALVLDREVLKKLDDEALNSVAGGCGGMRTTCGCQTF